MSSDDEAIKKASSAKTVKKTLMKFKGHVSTAVEPNPVAEQWAIESELANEAAADIFEAFSNLHTGEFCEFVARHPPDPLAVHRLINLALFTESPDKNSNLAKAKGAAYALKQVGVLEMWDKVKGTPSDKGKTHFAKHRSKDFGVAPSTIRLWLRNK